MWLNSGFLLHCVLDNDVVLMFHEEFHTYLQTILFDLIINRYLFTVSNISNIFVIMYIDKLYYIWQSTYSIKKYLKTNTHWKCCLYLKIVQSVSHKHYTSGTKINVQTVVHLQSLNAYFHTCYTIDICAIVFTC